jgi:hypothetical protein
LLVCGFVGGGTSVVAAETELTVTPRMEKTKRVTVAAIAR